LVFKCFYLKKFLVLPEINNLDRLHYTRIRTPYLSKSLKKLYFRFGEFCCSSLTKSMKKFKNKWPELIYNTTLTKKRLFFVNIDNVNFVMTLFVNLKAHKYENIYETKDKSNSNSNLKKLYSKIIIRNKLAFLSAHLWLH
jgi:hypothetical protein